MRFDGLLLVLVVPLVRAAKIGRQTANGAEVVRQLLRGNTLTEKDKQRAEELISLLPAVIKKTKKKFESEWRSLPTGILAC